MAVVVKVADLKNKSMKITINSLIICFLLSLSNFVLSQKNETENDIVLFVDEDPAYPGGMEAFIKFLSSNIHYPERALNKGIQGKCLVGFIVDKEGNIIDVKVLQKVKKCRECDAEAVRVIKLMPQWKPGEINGKPVKCRFQVPINFKLTN